MPCSRGEFASTVPISHLLKPPTELNSREWLTQKLLEHESHDYDLRAWLIIVFICCVMISLLYAKYIRCIAENCIIIRYTFSMLCRSYVYFVGHRGVKWVDEAWCAAVLAFVCVCVINEDEWCWLWRWNEVKAYALTSTSLIELHCNRHRACE